MDVSGVSQSSAQAAPSTYFQQWAGDLVKLGQALESGDLSGAQDAYNSLQTLAQNSPFGSAAAFAFTRRQQEFNVLGNDLQAGNLAAAQRVFSELRHNRAVDPANADGSDWPGLRRLSNSRSRSQLRHRPARQLPRTAAPLLTPPLQAQLRRISLRAVLQRHRALRRPLLYLKSLLMLRRRPARVL